VGRSRGNSLRDALPENRRESGGWKLEFPVKDDTHTHTRRIFNTWTGFGFGSDEKQKISPGFKNSRALSLFSRSGWTQKKFRQHTVLKLGFKG